MADPASSGENAGLGAPGQLTLLKLFPTPVAVTMMPDAENLNAELRRIILDREVASESEERSNRGGWQSSWDMHEWGGEPTQRLLSFARNIVDGVTVDRTGKHHELSWRIRESAFGEGYEEWEGFDEFHVVGYEETDSFDYEAYKANGFKLADEPVPYLAPWPKGKPF